MSNKLKATSIVPDSKPALKPKRRFPEFRNAEAWEATPLQKIASPVSERAVAGDRNNVLSLSGEHGLVLQDDYFGKKVAGDNVERYTKIVRNDFVYNDRTTKASVYGTIKRLYECNIGVVSPIYKCFRFDVGEEPHFWERYFEAGAHEAQLSSLVNEGARAGRFNISIIQFLSIVAWRPKKNEQQRIADCLSSVDELIAAQARKVDALKTYKTGLMQQLFPREGETQPVFRFPEFKGAPEWEEKPLSELVSALDAGVSVNSGDRPATDSEIGVLKTSAVTNGFFVPQENKVVLDEVEIGRVREAVRGDTLIISRMNTPALVGANAYVEKSLDNIFLPDRLWAAKSHPGASMRFVAFILGSNRGRASLSKLAKGSSGSMKNITKSGVLALMVMAPSLPEQQRIVDCLTSLDNLLIAQTQMLDAFKVHKKGLMQQLFPSSEEVEA